MDESPNPVEVAEDPKATDEPIEEEEESQHDRAGAEERGYTFPEERRTQHSDGRHESDDEVGLG